MSLDLHGYTVAEAVEIFVSHYNSLAGRGYTSRFTVVHGYGSGGTGGKIRTALRKFLAAFPDEVRVTTDPVNPGVTFVIPVKRLPEGAGILTGEILEFCSSGKSESRILGKFRNYGDLNVKKALKRLVSLKKLSCSRKGRHVIYSSRV
ncbi:hypothetical protein CSA37_02245 [Candidatus Fermentibacteria bacterium]|nr:MAG: hypothetical protein CSA37_02245 [Candidatus Fermentibacteria bacterium]